MAFDPDEPQANQGGTILEAVTKDQLNIGLDGQIRYRVAESNLYAYLFGVKNPIAHVMGYFVSVLRERIANFEAPPVEIALTPGEASAGNAIVVRRLDQRPAQEPARPERAHGPRVRSSAARYGIVLDASLITGIDPPPEVESALAAINTAHNQVSSDISLAQASADQKIVQSRRAVEIETLEGAGRGRAAGSHGEPAGASSSRAGPTCCKRTCATCACRSSSKADKAILEVPS